MSATGLAIICLVGFLLPVRIELAFILACATYYVARARRLRTFGGRGTVAVAVVLLFHVLNAPWLPR